jgi:hypothetical protein
MPPATASIWDDEFDIANGSAINAKWQWLNRNNATSTILGGKLILASQPVGSDSLMCLIQPTGSMPNTWSFAAKLDGTFPPFNFYTNGLIIYDTGSNRATTFGPGSAATWNGYSRTRWTNLTTWNAHTIQNTSWGGGSGYYKIQRSGNGTSSDVLTFSISTDGISWNQIGPTETVAAYMGSISHIGVVIDCNNATYSGSLGIGWFRGNWTASWDPTVNY